MSASTELPPCARRRRSVCVSVCVLCICVFARSRACLCACAVHACGAKKARPRVLRGVREGSKSREMEGLGGGERTRLPRTWRC
jgi:hypothetical protein